MKTIKRFFYPGAQGHIGRQFPGQGHSFRIPAGLGRTALVASSGAHGFGRLYQQGEVAKRIRQHYPPAGRIRARTALEPRRQERHDRWAVPAIWRTDRRDAIHDPLYDLRRSAHVAPKKKI